MGRKSLAWCPRLTAVTTRAGNSRSRYWTLLCTLGYASRSSSSGLFGTVPEGYAPARRDRQRALEACTLLHTHGAVELGEVGAYRFLLSAENIQQLRQFVHD